MFCCTLHGPSSFLTVTAFSWKATPSTGIPQSSGRCCGARQFPSRASPKSTLYPDQVTLRDNAFHLAHVAVCPDKHSALVHHCVELFCCFFARDAACRFPTKCSGSMRSSGMVRRLMSNPFVVAARNSFSARQLGLLTPRRLFGMLHGVVLHPRVSLFSASVTERTVCLCLSAPYADRNARSYMSLSCHFHTLLPFTCVDDSCVSLSCMHAGGLSHVSEFCELVFLLRIRLLILTWLCASWSAGTPRLRHVRKDRPVHVWWSLLPLSHSRNTHVWHRLLVRPAFEVSTETDLHLTGHLVLQHLLDHRNLSPHAPGDLSNFNEDLHLRKVHDFLQFGCSTHLRIRFRIFRTFSELPQFSVPLALLAPAPRFRESQSKNRL